MSKAIKRFLGLVLPMLWCSEMFATSGPPPPTTPPPPPGLPLDGNLWGLIIVSLVYGLYMIYKKRASKLT